MPRRIGEGMRWWTLAFVVCLLPALAAAEVEVRFDAEVDRQAITLDDSIQLTVTLSVAGGRTEDFELPPTPDFEVRSRGQSQQSSFQFSLGGGRSRTRTQVHTLVLRPLKEGELVIGSGRAVIDGKTYRTAPIRVRVGPGGGPAPTPSPSGDPRLTADRGRGEVFVEVQLDKERAYVGEEILLSVWLYARTDVSHVSSVSLPELDGFWIGEIANPTQLSARMQEVGGVPYRVYLLSRKAIFGLRPGTIEIAPATVELTVGDRFFGRGRSLRRASQPMEVEILPLPPAESELSLGGVGAFRLLASASPLRVRVGDPITFRLEAAGRGNLSAIEFPALPEIEGLRAFEPTETERIDVSGGHYAGERVREIVLVPERAGHYEIPALPWLVFDPAAEAYRRLETEAFAIEVRGERSTEAPAIGSAVDRLPLREPPRLAPPRTHWREGWYALALAGPGLLLLGGLLLPRLRGREGRRRDPGKDALAALRRRGEGEAWSEAIPRILHAYLSARVGQATAGLERRELAGRLAKARIPPAAIDSLERLLDACDRDRFAPESPESAPGNPWERAQAWVEGVERALGRGER